MGPKKSLLANQVLSLPSAAAYGNHAEVPETAFRTSNFALSTAFNGSHVALS